MGKVMISQASIRSHLDGGGGCAPSTDGAGLPSSQVQAEGTPSTDGGYPFPRSRGTPPPGKGVPPAWEGVPPPGKGVPPAWEGVPPDPRGIPYLNSIACTCYAAGGVPLAFTQEDFLFILFWY